LSRNPFVSKIYHRNQNEISKMQFQNDLLLDLLMTLQVEGDYLDCW